MKNSEISAAFNVVPTDSIKPNAYNPNRHTQGSYDLLLRSIREDGFTQPILVHAQSREIVDGEHRWRAALELKLPTIPVILVEMTPEQMRIATIRHNRARGAEDFDAMAGLMHELRDLGALLEAQTALQMSDAELARLIQSIPSVDVDDIFVPAPLRAPETGPGSANYAEELEKYNQKRREYALTGPSTMKRERDEKAAEKAAASYQIHAMVYGDDVELVLAVLGTDASQHAAKIVELCTLAAAAEEK